MLVHSKAHLPPSAQMLYPGQYQQQHRGNFAQQGDAPLFERMGQDELAEIQLIQQQLGESEERRMELERINLDLERRLEVQAKERMNNESEMAEETRVWQQRLAQADDRCKEWKGRCEMEQKHREVLVEKLRRTEKELHRILQKKYDIVKAAKAEERLEQRARTRI